MSILSRQVDLTLIEVLVTLRHVRQIRDQLEQDLRVMMKGRVSEHMPAARALEAEVAVLGEVIRKMWEQTQ